jgi:hypothetical protein
LARRKPQLVAAAGAPPRSLYRKIQIVLAEVRKGRNRSGDDLTDQILGRGHLDFTRYQTTQEHATELVPCSRESILRVIETCEKLKLVDSVTFKLTPLGLRAADPRLFDEVLRRSVPAVLNQLGIPMSEIRLTIRDMLAKSNPHSLPTAEAIYERLVSDGNVRSREEFKSYLSLLGACNGIAFSRKKIYLPS